MRNLLIVCCIMAQVAGLGYMVFGREHVIRNGRSISIKTAPIDPRDPFRGDFVRLRYAMNSFGNAPIQWQPVDYEPKKGDKIYAVLNQRSGGLHEILYFTNKLPDLDATPENIAIRGRVTYISNQNWPNVRNAKFGVEQFFVEQGRGIDIENRRGTRGEIQNAMHIAMSVSDDGTAVVTGHSWSALAIGLEITNTFDLNTNRDTGSETNATITTNTTNNITTNTNSDSNADSNTDPEPNNSDKPEAPIKIQVENVSDHPVTLNNPGDNCGFSIEPATPFTSYFASATNACTSNTDIKLVTLAPQETLVVNVELSNPRWYVTLNVNTQNERISGSNESTPNEQASDSNENNNRVQNPESDNTNQNRPRSGDLRTFTAHPERFRIVYRSAKSDNPDNQSPELWQGDLLSQAFNSQGRID